jgi:two-component system phosphate regulon response regulator PhoB
MLANPIQLLRSCLSAKLAASSTGFASYNIPMQKAGKPRILVVDDEPDTLELIEFNLRGAGYDVITAEDGAAALKKARHSLPELIILDLMLPELDGLEVCKILRADLSTKDIPILMLTAKAEEIDRILGLELGARDYVTKPFSPRELVLRVRNLLKPKDADENESQHLQIGDLDIDIPRHVATLNRKPLDLTATEFRLLVLLVQRRGRVQTRDQLLQDVWNYENSIDTRTVDTHIRRLRDKLGKAARHLDTVRGVGYRFLEK